LCSMLNSNVLLVLVLVLVLFTCYLLVKAANLRVTKTHQAKAPSFGQLGLCLLFGVATAKMHSNQHYCN
jgi:hypothetical protein